VLLLDGTFFHLLALPPPLLFILETYYVKNNTIEL